jgi:hypothetical protein
VNIIVVTVLYLRYLPFEVRQDACPTDRVGTGRALPIITVTVTLGLVGLNMTVCNEWAIMYYVCRYIMRVHSMYVYTYIHTTGGHFSRDDVSQYVQQYLASGQLIIIALIAAAVR